METTVTKTHLEEIKSLRTLFLDENHFQFIYDKCHLYGWADSYVFRLNGVKIGYGAVWGRSTREVRDAVFEFYIVQSYRKFADAFFSSLQVASGATFIECQSNDLLLTSILYEYAKNINAEAVLFEDHFQTNFVIHDTILEAGPGEGNCRDDERKFVLKRNKEVVATGGLMMNYNMPYADLYYEVHEGSRQKGFGSLMVQELKKQAYLIGRVPAARCNINNFKSKATLLKTGFNICGYILVGEMKRTQT